MADKSKVRIAELSEKDNGKARTSDQIDRYLEETASARTEADKEKEYISRYGSGNGYRSQRASVTGNDAYDGIVTGNGKAQGSGMQSAKPRYNGSLIVSETETEDQYNSGSHLEKRLGYLGEALSDVSRTENGSWQRGPSVHTGEYAENEYVVDVCP